MIQPDLLPPTLRALQRLIVHAKDQAYEFAGPSLGEFLNEFELLPECLADEADRTDEVIATLHGIAQVHPACRYIIEEFDRACPCV